MWCSSWKSISSDERNETIVYVKNEKSRNQNQRGQFRSIYSKTVFATRPQEIKMTKNTHVIIKNDCGVLWKITENKK